MSGVIGSIQRPLDREIERAIVHERIRLLYRYVPSTLAASFLAMAVMTYLMWKEVPAKHLLLWVGVMLLSYPLRGLQFRAYFRDTHADANASSWARRYAVQQTLAGAIWGAVPLFLFPSESPLTQAMITTVFAGVGAGSVGLHALYLPALNGFLIMIYVPLALRWASFGGPGYALALLILAFLAYIMFYGRNAARLIEETLRLRFENARLAAQLEQEKSIAENAREVAEIARASAEEGVRAKSRFFAAANHDLRQPLHALGMLAASLQDVRATPETHLIADRIGDGIDALERLFSSILDLSRFDAGVLQAKQAHFPAQRLLDQMAATYAPAARASDLALRVVPSRAVIHSDPNLLGRALSNLVSNAVRYTSTGAITVGVRRRGDALAIEVRDSGFGIPKEEHERIFEEFYQVGNPERDRRRGLGLGLATTKRIAELIGAKIELRSAPGIGSVFSLIVEPGDAAQVLPPAPVATGPLADPLMGRTILVLDDEPLVRESMRMLLRKWGCTVYLASDPEEAEREALDNPPDLFIADVRLRNGASGIDAVARLREKLGRALPAILISGETSIERLREIRAASLPLLIKPVRPVQLRAALNQSLSQAMQDAAKMADATNRQNAA